MRCLIFRHQQHRLVYAVSRGDWGASEHEALVEGCGALVEGWGTSEHEVLAADLGMLAVGCRSERGLAG